MSRIKKNSTLSLKMRRLLPYDSDKHGANEKRKCVLPYFIRRVVMDEFKCGLDRLIVNMDDKNCSFKV